MESHKVFLLQLFIFAMNLGMDPRLTEHLARKPRLPNLANVIWNEEAEVTSGEDSGILQGWQKVLPLLACPSLPFLFSTQTTASK